MARSGVLVRAGNRKGTPAMYGYGKSDDPIVPKKQPNKGERSLAEVVSMRPLKPADAIRAIQITSRYPAVHGAPVHIGLPAKIGIADLSKPDYGDSVRVYEDELPVFWACGVTPQAALVASKPGFAITHSPGSMLVTDLKNRQYAVI